MSGNDSETKYISNLYIWPMLRHNKKKVIILTISFNVASHNQKILSDPLLVVSNMYFRVVIDSEPTQPGQKS